MPNRRFSLPRELNRHFFPGSLDPAPRHGWVAAISGQYSDAPGRGRISLSASVNRLLDFFSAATLFPMTQCLSGPGLRLHMQDAGRCGASCLLEIYPCPQLAISPRRGRSPALARSCRHSGTTGPFTRIGRRFSLLLSSSGGGLFDGRPKTQTWVWGAFVLSSTLGSDSDGQLRMAPRFLAQPRAHFRSRLPARH